MTLCLVKRFLGPTNLAAAVRTEIENQIGSTRARRIKDAHFPKVKTLEEFAFSDAPHIPAAQVRNLAEGGYLQRSEPVIFLGETNLNCFAVEGCRLSIYAVRGCSVRILT
jgi:hypothetical protein